ncbi:DNA cytosine methyltransferase, partial [Ruminococcus sp.]|uniref:DNA cytosine methyltransferase n=1 Tax=Ruminococcus sp. TaxID=41978 RepID=UPI0025E905FD
ETVPGILSMKNGDVIKGVYQALQNLGYIFHSAPWILDAERYGVPQMRKRVVIVAAKDPTFLPDYPEPIFEKCLGRREQLDMQMSFSISTYPITVGEALIGLPPLMEVNKYYPINATIDSTYNRWCKGEIDVETLLAERSKKMQRT